MFNNIKNFAINDNELDQENQRFLSIIFLFLSGLMCFFEYTHIGWIWDTKLTFKPGFIETLIAIILVAPLYIRGILKWKKSIYTILSFILILLVFASFIKLALGGENNMFTNITLFSAILLSWLGIREIAGTSWMFLLASVIPSAINNSETMGFYGFIYILLGFLGLVLHSQLSPGQLVSGLKKEYTSSVSNISNTVKNDIDATVEIVKDTISVATKLT